MAEYIKVPAGVYDMVTRCMEQEFPDHVAIRYVAEDGKTVVEKKYREYAQDIRRMTAYLKAEVPDIKGRRIVLLSRNCYEFCVASFGIILAGGVLVTLNQKKTWEELEYELGLVEPALILNTPMVNSVLHATKILDYYASQRREYLSLTEISRAIGLHKTTVYRILRTLQSVGWIEQSSTNGQYRLGSGILMIASAVSVHYTTRQLISEEMRRLCDLHNETVVLSSLRGDTGICVDLVKGHHNLGISSENGYIVPLDCGATGKTLLAAQSDELVERLIQNYPGLEEKLRNQVKEIRQRGYCISEGEVDEGVAAVAVPLPMPDHIYTRSAVAAMM